MTVTKVTIVDSPEKMRNQNSGYTVIIPQVKETVSFSEQKMNKMEPHSDVKPKE